MRKSYVTIYDIQMKKVAYLENAFNIQYETPMNTLWNASFSLPANDPKNAECQPLYYAEIYDNDERLELFRILPSTLRRSRDGQTVTYQCEHVLGTLLDDILFLYHTVGNLGVYTADVIRYILSKQSTQRWKLGNVEISRQFEYNWENENLLGALFSVPKPFDEDYMWTWDTTTYPWTVNLVKPSNQVQAYIRYGVNMQGIEKVIDPSNVVTRIYGLGYGEGVNQLTFAELNGGKPYLDAEPQYIQKYGLMQSVFVDRRFEYPETLMARCKALLDELKQPKITYVVQASELYALTKDPIDKFRTGTMVRVQDKELGEDVTVRVMNVRKQDVLGAPGNVEIEIANRPQDIAGSIAELRNRQYINEVYAQGATNYDTQSFADNADPQHPAVLRFRIPEETARINKVLLSYRVEAFRGYSKAIEGGGDISTTTAAGGASIQPTKTIAGHSSMEGGATYDGQGRIITGSIEVTSGGVDMIIPVSSPERYVETIDDGTHSHTVSANGSHNHGGAAASHNHGNQANQSTAPAISSDGQHTHTVSGGAHNHVADISHTHMARYHTHRIDHSHEIQVPDHKHDLTIPAHTHAIEFGIYEGPTPPKVEVRIDGTVVPGLTTNIDEADIIPYLSKDDSGKVQRGWHEIKIAPVNSLGRIVASVFTQIFAQSRGGGNY